jgi:hypothetical protein
MIPENFTPNIEAVTEGYRQGTFTPRELFAYLLDKADGFEDRNIWITRLSMESLEPYLARLDASSPEELPLYGVPFAGKGQYRYRGRGNYGSLPRVCLCGSGNCFPCKATFRCWGNSSRQDQYGSICHRVSRHTLA